MGMIIAVCWVNCRGVRDSAWDTAAAQLLSGCLGEAPPERTLVGREEADCVRSPCHMPYVYPSVRSLQPRKPTVPVSQRQKLEPTEMDRLLTYPEAVALGFQPSSV